jgi:hypothetical protein
VNHLHWLYYKNQSTRAKWYMRWALQGGSFFYPAHPLKDLRSLSSQQTWREIQFLAKSRRSYAKRLHEKRYGVERNKSVVNLATVRFERVRRQTLSRAESAGILGRV